jgi:GT2 family glycosyltransferase
MTDPTVSVAVITYERPEFVARCLDRLLAQTRPPSEIVVIDSSPGRRTEQLIGGRYPTVAYLRSDAGAGAMATARNLGYRSTRGEVLAFIDDDAFAEPEWLERLLPPYGDPTVGAVGGRQVRGQPGEITEGVDDIGRLRADGNLSGNFTADPGQIVEVDHLLGANMSFRRSVLDQIGGIRDGYAGTCVREETDLCLRVARAGYRLLYTPDAVVEHVAAPYAKGRRFDLRYAYWAQKNHLIVLIRNFGPAEPIVRTYLVTSVRQAVRACLERFGRDGDHDGDHDGALRAGVAGLARLAVVLGATVSGTVTGCVLLGRDRKDR